MSEMKPCPFCGNKALTNIFLDYEDIENLPTNVIDDYEPEVTCENERCIYGWWLSPKDWNNRPIEDALHTRIAELEAENAGLKERVAMLDVTAVFKSLGEMGYIEQTDKLHTRIAELEEEQVILKDQMREAKNILIDKNLHIDSLYEEGYKLQQRIAELEAAQRWIPVSERLPEFNKVVAVIDMSDKDSHLCNVYETAILVEVRGDTRFGFIGHSGWDSSDVTHWMPLPKLPEVTG